MHDKTLPVFDWTSSNANLGKYENQTSSLGDASHSPRTKEQFSMTKKDWSQIVGNTGRSQYDERITALKGRNVDTPSIETAIRAIFKNLKVKKARSLVVFGEPQSGKTEMMIALNARLLDEGYTVIVNLLTDSVDLLDQSLNRFRSSGLNPSPKQFSDLPTDPKRLKGRSWVVFCKKNARDLEKLIEYLRLERNLIVIDDEADYASPDGNVNKPDYDKTKINLLISNLLGCVLIK